MTTEWHEIDYHMSPSHRALREPNVNASTVAAIAGHHPYVTRMKLWAEKRGVMFDTRENRAMRRGRWLESAFPSIVKDKRPEWDLEPAKVYLCDHDLRLGASPDFFVRNDPRGLAVVQGKTLAPSVYEREWDAGREIPFWVILQVLTEMMLADAAFGVVAALVVDPYAMDCSVLEVPRHAQAEARLRAMVASFWDDVTAGREPTPDYERDDEIIRLLTPHEAKGKSIDLSGNNELPGLLARRAMLQRRIKHDEAACDLIESEVRHVMGDAETATGVDGFKISYRTTHRAPFSVGAKDIRVLRITDNRPPEERPEDDLET